MLNYRTFAVIKREIKAQVMSKAFIFMTILMPLLMFGFMAFQAYIMSYESKSKVSLIVVEETPFINAQLEQELAGKDFVANGQYAIRYETKSADEFDNFLEASRQDLLDDKITGIIFIPDSARVTKRIRFYSANPSNFDVMGKVRGEINNILIKNYFSDKDINDDDLRFARKSVDFEQIRVSKEGIEKEGIGNKVIAFVFTFLLFLSLLVIGQQLMYAVNEEKANRVVEVLLSSVNTQELMAGKILGTAITGLTQMIIWSLPIAVVSLGSIGMLAAVMSELNLQISLLQVGYFFVNYFIGLLTYLSLFAGFGAIFENQQDAQSGLWPVMLLIMIPFYLTFSMVKNPANIIAEVSSVVPFASILVMPARLALIDVPLWQIGLAVLVNLATMYLIVRMVGKIYRVGVLMTGKKPTWPEVYKWLKYGY